MRIIIKKILLSLLKLIVKYTSAYSRRKFINLAFNTLYHQNLDCPWSVNYTTQVTHTEKIKIGEGVEESFMYSGGCYIQGMNGIEIGDETIFAPGVKIISANHDPWDYNRWLPDEPVIIGKRCWIGANAVILPGVKLGDHVIVGAGAVVTKSFPDNTVIAGNPARIIRHL